MGIDKWIVEAIVSELTADPDVCIALNNTLIPANGNPRVRRGGRRINLTRYLHERLNGATLDPKVALLRNPQCETRNCMNPNHRLPSRRRTLPKRKGR